MDELPINLNATLESIGCENMRIEQFYRTYITRRVSDIAHILSLDKLKELPLYSVLHVMDNLNLDREITYVPDTTNPLFVLKPNKKVIYHVTHLESQSPVDFDVKALSLPSSGLTSQLMDFRNHNSKNCRIVASLQDLPNLRSDLNCIVSYNSLFRARIFGVRRRVKLTNFLLANLVNTLAKMPDRDHFIHIPISTLQFRREHFQRAFKQLNNQAYFFPENMHYLFLVHFYSFVESTSNSSIFEFIPEAMLSKVNFVFQIKDKFVIHNLATIREMNGDHNQILLRLIAQLNILAADGIEVPEAAVDETATVQHKAEQIPIAEPELLTVEPAENKLNIPEFSRPITQQEHKVFVETEAEAIDTAADRVITHIKEGGLTPHDKTMSTPIVKITSFSAAQYNRIKQIGEAYKNLALGGKPLTEIIKNTDTDTLDSNHLDFLKDVLEDKSMMSSSITKFNQTYMKKTFHKHLAKVLLSFNNHGMFLTNLEESLVHDELNRLRTYKAVFEDVNHKTHPIKFTIPEVDEDGNCLINGSLKTFKKQRVSNPICKVSPTRVTLNSNFNKYLVERNTNVAHSFYAYLMAYLNKQENNRYRLSYGNTDTSKQVLPYEYTAICRKLTGIEVVNGNREATQFIFNPSNRFQGLTQDEQAICEDYEKANGICFGLSLTPKTRIAYFIQLSGQVTGLEINENHDVYNGTFIDLLGELFGMTPPPLNEWVDFKLLNKSVPLIFALSYRFGLTNILHYINADFQIQDVNTRVVRKPSDIVIRFADKRLIVHRTPMLVSLLVSGLNYFDLSNTLYESMDTRDVYYDLIQSKKMNIHYLKGIDSFFELFIDPITKDVLNRMHEPTNTKDLLIRAVQLLTTEDHKPASSCANFRIRSYEQIVATVYNELARAYATYKYQAIGATHRFSMSEYIIKQRILQAQLMENVDTINPINDIKYNCGFSHVGSGGRSAETFRIEDRKFPADGIGIISEATVDNGKVALNAQLSMNPSIVDTLGMTISKPIDEITPTEMLSVSALLMPGATYDDGKRCNFLSIQLSHYVPTVHNNQSRIRTGYERVIAHLTRPPFAYTAQQDGVVEAIDDKLKIVRIRYKDDTVTCVKYGETYSNNGGGGFYITQQVVINNFNVGDKFKRGDVICYNSNFFAADLYSKQIDFYTGVTANVALIECDGTIEDSDTVCLDLAKKLQFNPVQIKDIALTKDTTIHEYAAVGTKVKSTDVLMTFDQSEIPDTMQEKADASLIELLNDLNRATPKSKYTGEVVKIEVFYKCKIVDMSASLANLVNKINQPKNERAKFVEGASNAHLFPKAAPITGTDRIANTLLDEDVVIIRFYIKQDTEMNTGDKIVIDSSLKSVCAKVIPDKIQTEDGSIEVELLTSCRGINNRIVFSPLIVGVGSLIMEKHEKNMLDMYFDEE